MWRQESMNRLEYPGQDSIYECEKCEKTAILVEPNDEERRKRLIDFLEEHLAVCY